MCLLVPVFLPTVCGLLASLFGVAQMRPQRSLRSPLFEPPREDMTHGERVGGGAADRRRERRLRMFWRHEQLSLRMMRAAMEHHSW